MPSKGPFQVGDLILYYGHIARVNAILGGHQDRTPSGRFGALIPRFICFRFRGDAYTVLEPDLLKHQTPWYNDHGTWHKLYERPSHV